MKKLSKTDAAYLAGIIDGEGTVFVSRTDSSKSAKACKRGFAYRSGLAVSMTNRSIVLWMKRITGIGKISGVRRHKKNHKPGFRWSVWSKQASTLLLLLYPYLKLKRRHAANQLRFQLYMRLTGYKGVSSAEWNRREKRRQISLQLK